MFDPTTLSAQAKAHYIQLGKYYASEDTLAQANETLQALADHGPELAQHGFSAAHTQRLTDGRDALEAAGVTRAGQKGTNKRARQAHADALRDSMAQRERGRSVVEASVITMREAGAPEEAQRLAASTLAQTSRAPTGKGKAVQLDTQLQLLLTALGNPTIAAAVADSGGPEAVSALTAASASLTTANRQRPKRRGTPEATEHLDLLDGLVVTLCRQARRAGRGAALRLGTPALAKAFALTSLRRESAKGGEVVDEDEVNEDEAGEEQPV